MKDLYGRKIGYMRISITDRCNMSCYYCKKDTEEKLCHSDILSYEELIRVCREAVKLGIKKFKVTGGEPFARKGCIDFLSMLKAEPGIEEVTVTTNGSLFGKAEIEELARLHINGINFSLDVIDEKDYQKITRVNAFEKVISNIESAVLAGLNVKINTVLLSDFSENYKKNILDIMIFAMDRNIPVRFIEYMPVIKDISKENCDRKYVRSVLEENGFVLEKADCINIGNGPASYYRLREKNGALLPGMVGFIEAIHGKFCESCNRIRLTSTGCLKPCLYFKDNIDVREILRNNGNNEDIKNAIIKCIESKPKCHEFENKISGMAMNEIGG